MLNKRRAKAVSAMTEASTSCMNTRAMGAGMRKMTSADVGGAAAEAVVGGDGEKHIAAVAQVRFDRHGRRRVAGAARQFGQRVACAGGDKHEVE